MKTVKFICLLITLIVLSIFTINCEDKTKILAKVDQEIISKEDFQDFIKLRFQNAQISEFSYEYRKKIIIKMIENRKKTLYATELGYHKEDKFIRDRAYQLDYLSAVKLTDLEIVEKYVTPEMVKAIFDLQNNKRKINMIILGFQDSPKFKAERTKSETIDLANQILREIKPENSFIVENIPID